MNETIFYFFYNFSKQSEFFYKFIFFVAEVFPYFLVFFALLFLLLHHENKSSPDRMFSIPTRTILSGWIRARWEGIVLVFFSSIFAWFLSFILKIIFKSPRPFLALDNITPVWVESGYAFPSGHATFFMALAFAIFLNHKKEGYLFILFAFIIGIARIIAGVHFPIDILGGFVLGGWVAYLVRYLYGKSISS